MFWIYISYDASWCTLWCRSGYMWHIFILMQRFSLVRLVCLPITILVTHAYMIIRTHWYNPLPCATICHRYNRSIYTNYICNCVYKNFSSCGFRFLLSTQFPIAFRFLWQLSMFPHSRNGWDQDNHLPLQTHQRFVVQNQQTWVIILDLDPYQHLEIMA